MLRGRPLCPCEERRALTRTAESTEQTQTGLDGVAMRVVEMSDSSVIGPETLFHFTQQGTIVRAEYEGGAIVAGSLVGYRNGVTLNFCFSQLESPLSWKTGTSVCTVRRQDGALELIEEFCWDDKERPSGRNILREIS